MKLLRLLYPLFLLRLLYLHRGQKGRGCIAALSGLKFDLKLLFSKGKQYFTPPNFLTCINSGWQKLSVYNAEAYGMSYALEDGGYEVVYGSLVVGIGVGVHAVGYD